MIRAPLILGNLMRAKARTFLLLLSIFVAFLLFGMLASFERAFSAGPAGPQRMVTVNKISFTQPLPLAHFERVRGMDGVAAATHATWFGGYYQDPRNVLHAMAVEPQSYLRVYRDDLRLSPAEREAFLGDRSAVIVGAAMARRWGWSVGDRIPLHSSRIVRHDGTRAWSFVVAGVFEGASERIDTNFLYLHYELLNEARASGRDTLGWIVLEPEAGLDGPALGERVDRLFAVRDVSTTTDTERSFNQAFVAQFGNIAWMVLAVGAASFLSLLLILGNTMMMAVRERSHEIGVLKVLGFSGAAILAFVLAEVLLLVIAGGVAGLAASALLAHGMRADLLLVAPGMAVTWRIWLMGFVLMIGVAVAAGLPSAIGALRLKPAAALGRH